MVASLSSALRLVSNVIPLPPSFASIVDRRDIFLALLDYIYTDSADVVELDMAMDLFQVREQGRGSRNAKTAA